MNRYFDMMTDPDKFIVHNRWISDEERAAAFQQTRVVVLPYVEATQSGVVPIAYANSKPVVATRTGGLPDVVDDGKTGILVEPRDEVALANAVIKLLKDTKLCDSMGNAGKRKLQNGTFPSRRLQTNGRGLSARNRRGNATKNSKIQVAANLSVKLIQCSDDLNQLDETVDNQDHILTDIHVNAAISLHLVSGKNSLEWDSLSGPDPGIRFNTRVGRFVKSYFSLLPWSDNLVYMQAQGYWIFGNWQTV